MTSLVGKAQDEDDAFWSHETWAEDDSGNESFRESDEDSSARVDQFDSDFDESESDHEEEEEAAGVQAEVELAREERIQKRKQRFDVAKAGRDLMQKKKGKGKKRAMGDGINAGLVLNFPPSVGGAQPPAPPPAVPPAPVIMKAEKPAPRRTSPRSPTGKKRLLRAATVSKSQQAETKRKATAASTTTTTTTTKRKQKRFTQEELLLEAATVTEAESERWLLARQRGQQTEDALHKGPQDETRGKVICKFRSRRGCLNSLTFPEMDHIPDILARKHVAPPKKKVPIECVITGKKARYRDPKTMVGYYDADAFKELRRRLNAGEPLDQRKKLKKADTDVIMTDAEQNGETSPAVNGGTTGTKAAPAEAKKDTVLVDAQSLKAEKVKAKRAATNGGAVESSTTQGTALKVTKPSAAAASLPRSRSSSGGRSSPRKRKLSAKAMAAVETELLSPSKAQISNVIRNMSAPPESADRK